MSKKLEEISTLLVGRNAHLQKIKYSDDYLNKLNEKYSLKRLLGKIIDEVTLENARYLGYFTKKALNNSDAEDILKGILIQSAKIRIWNSKIMNFSKLAFSRIRSADEYLDAIVNNISIYEFGKSRSSTVSGISIAHKEGFVLLSKYENSVIIIPSQKFVEYCFEKKEKKDKK